MSRFTQRVVAAIAVCGGVACGSTQSAEAPAQPSPGSVGATVADAGLSVDDYRIGAIQHAVNETVSDRHECWAMAAARDFRIHGQVLLTVAFAGESTVESITVAENQTGSDPLAQCLITLYRRFDWPPVFGRDVIVSLPFQFLEARAQYTIRGTYVDAIELAGGKLAVSIVLDEANSGNPAAAMSLLTMRDGLDVALHRHSSAEVLTVLSGTGVVYDLDGVKKGVKVAAGAAIYVPAGTAHGFVQTGAEPTVLVQHYAPGGPEQRFKGGSDAGTTPVADKEITRPKRGFPRPIVRRIADADELVIAGGNGSVQIVFDEHITGNAGASFGVIALEPGVVVPGHVHDGETEMLLMMAGEGILTIGATTYQVKEGDAVQIPKGTQHGFSVRGSERVVALQLYTPAGPEQRFKK